jgi:hypothetical protein
MTSKHTVVQFGTREDGSQWSIIALFELSLLECMGMMQTRSRWWGSLSGSGLNWLSLAG